LYHGAESGLISHDMTAIPIFSKETTINLMFSGTNGMLQYQVRLLTMITEGKAARCIMVIHPDLVTKFYSGAGFRTPVYLENQYVSGRFMVQKIRQLKGNIFEVSLIQKFD